MEGGGATPEEARDESRWFGAWESFDTCLIEGLRLSLVPSRPGPWYDDGLETLTQSGSGLGVKGFLGLLSFKIEYVLGGCTVDRAGSPNPQSRYTS